MRHGEVGDHQVEWLVLEKRQRGARIGLRDGDVAEARQEAPAENGQHRLIIDKEDALTVPVRSRQDFLGPRGRRRRIPARGNRD